MVWYIWLIDEHISRTYGITELYTNISQHWLGFFAIQSKRRIGKEMEMVSNFLSAYKVDLFFYLFIPITCHEVLRKERKGIQENERLV